MTSQTAPQAGIIGAGIAGLCAAIALRRAGWHVEIFEKSQFKNEVGAAITVPPNATRVLRHWGFDFKSAGAVRLQTRRFFNGASLECVDKEDFPDIEDKLEAPAWALHRVDLHQELKRLALAPNDGQEELVKLHLGQPITEIDVEAGVIKFSDGTSTEKNLIVVADGVRSATAKYVNSVARDLHPIGRSAYRCLIPLEQLKADPDIWKLYDDKLAGFIGFMTREPDVLLISYSCRDNKVMNIAIVHDTHPTEGEEDLWHSPAKKSDVLQDMRTFHPNVKKILEYVNEEELAVHHLWARKPLDSFVNGTAIVVGDAAHAMAPTHAAGGSMAIESAAFLEVLFKGVGSQDHAKIQHRAKLFDKLRVPRCNLVMILSNNGHWALHDPKVEQEIRRFYTGPLPAKEHGSSWSSHMREFMFHYDAFKIAEEALAKESN